MGRVNLVVAGSIVVMVVGVMLYAGARYLAREDAKSFANTFRSQTEIPAATLSASITASLPPLYTEIRWGQPRRATSYILDSQGKEIMGQLIESERTNGKDPALWGIFGYYSRYLTEAYGWERCCEAGGPGSSVMGWKKRERYFIVEVSSSPSTKYGFAKIWHN